MDEADGYIAQAQELLQENGDSLLNVWIFFNQSFRHAVAGSFDKAVELGARALDISRSLQAPSVTAMACHNLAWSLYYMGRFEQGLHYAEEGKRITETHRLRENTSAWLFMDEALNKTGLKRHASALEDAKTALGLFRELECRWGQAYAFHALQIASMGLGDLQSAGRYIRDGFECIEGLGLPLDKGYLQNAMADVLLHAGKHAEAVGLLKKAEVNLRSSRFHLGRTYLLQARLLWMSGDHDTAVKTMKKAVALSEDHGYDAWIIAECEWILPLLIELHARGFNRTYIKMLVPHMGENTRQELTRAADHTDPLVRAAAVDLLAGLPVMSAPGLTVFCLGQFKVMRGNSIIASGAWKSRKARALFKILFHRRSAGFTPKDMLMEMIWPEEDPARANNRFHVAMTALRKVLEPEGLKQSRSSYILKDGDAYRLDLGKGGSADADDFKEAIRRAKTAGQPQTSIAQYIQAVKVYGGDYFEEDPYEAWCEMEREGLREQYLSALMSVIEYYYNRREYKSCIAYARKHLETDPYAEPVYRYLMKSYTESGLPAKAASTYRQCVEKLRDGLGCEVSEETAGLYERLASR